MVEDPLARLRRDSHEAGLALSDAKSRIAAYQTQGDEAATEMRSYYAADMSDEGFAAETQARAANAKANELRRELGRLDEYVKRASAALTRAEAVERMRRGTEHGRRRAKAMSEDELAGIAAPGADGGYAETRMTGPVSGRSDFLGDLGGGDGLLGEVKHTDWDKIAPARIVPRAQAHARQVLRYAASNEVARISDDSLQMFLEYARRPRDTARANLIEDVLAGYGVTVSWIDG